MAAALLQQARGDEQADVGVQFTQTGRGNHSARPRVRELQCATFGFAETDAPRHAGLASGSKLQLTVRRPESLYRTSLPSAFDSQLHHATHRRIWKASIQEATVVPPEQHHRGRKSSSCRCRLPMLDDHKDFAMSIQELFTARGCQVEIARSRRRALQLAVSATFDVSPRYPSARFESIHAAARTTHEAGLRAGLYSGTHGLDPLGQWSRAKRRATSDLPGVRRLLNRTAPAVDCECSSFPIDAPRASRAADCRPRFVL